jgi:cytidylate kinase
MASRVAALPEVRAALLERQRGFQDGSGLVADGRDMGTTVFPDAILKVYLTASVEARADRRYKQLIAKGIDANLPALRQQLEERDARDSERSASPLHPAEDAFVIDSTELSIQQTEAQLEALARDKGLLS